MSTTSDDNSSSSNGTSTDEFAKKLYGFWQDQMTTMSTSPEVVDFFKKMTHNMTSFGQTTSSTNDGKSHDKNAVYQNRAETSATSPIDDGSQLGQFMQRLEFKLNQLDDRLSRIEYLLQKQSSD